jgi:hypothetical protein
MRTIRINADRTVEEIDAEAFDWLDQEVDWDCVTISPGVDIWTRDDGLETADTVAVIAGHRLPLPAFVTGADGERTVASTLSLEQVQELIG